MGFGEAIGETIFNYMNFRDRASRAEYWWWVLFAVIVGIVAAILDLLLFYGWENGPFAIVTNLALFFPGLSVTVRRLHDTNRSGWWVLLLFVLIILTVAGVVAATIANPFNPVSGAGLVYIAVPGILTFAYSILIFIWTLLPSNPGNNRYGPNRYAGA
jgi:uncharacterized membrane protein YhaH (DUF805 family)